MTDHLDTIINVLLAFVLAISLIPVGLEMFYATGTTNWTDASVVALWGILAIVFIIVFVVLIVRMVPKRGKR